VSPRKRRVGLGKSMVLWPLPSVTSEESISSLARGETAVLSRRIHLVNTANVGDHAAN
jgi:hypothetical protein